jgi:hypothetical protein
MAETLDKSLSGLGYRPGQAVPYGEWVPLEKIAENPENPPSRSGSDLSYRELALSMEAHGQGLPVILIRRLGNYILSDGHRRRRVAAELGWSALWAVWRYCDPTDLAALINTATKPWRSQEVLETAAARQTVISIVPHTKARHVAKLMELLGDKYPLFASRFGLRGFYVSRRVANYLGWPPERTLEVIDYVLASPEGVIRRLEEALRDGIAPDRLSGVIRAGEPLVPRW